VFGSLIGLSYYFSASQASAYLPLAPAYYDEYPRAMKDSVVKIKPVLSLCLLFAASGCYHKDLKTCRSEVRQREMMCHGLARERDALQDSPEYVYGQAVDALLSKDRDQAITHFVEVAREHPKSPLALEALKELKKIGIPDAEYRKLEGPVKDHRRAQ